LDTFWCAKMGVELARVRPGQRVVDKMRFGLYTSEEVKRLSVKRISNPVIMDPLNNPVKDGLYDDALGPLDRRSGTKDSRATCSTCRLTFRECPGHCGHVELCVPVYNPMTFATVFRLLRCTCLNCFRFRLKGEMTDEYVRILRLLREGRLAEAMDVRTVPMNPVIAELLGGDDDAADAAASPSTSSSSSSGDMEETWHTAQAFDQAVESLLRSMAGTGKSNKCANCQAASPRLVKDAQGRIFREGLDGKAVLSNEAVNADIEASLRGIGMKELGGTLESQVVAEAEGDSDAQQQRSPPSGRAYIHPAQAMGILNRLWRNERDLATLVWLADQRSSASAAVEPPSSSAASAASASSSMSDPRRFFVQSLLVPPNKLRPPSEMGDLMFENVQNGQFKAVIEANLRLTDLIKAPRENDTSNREERIFGAWLQLQQAVTAVMDSPADSGAEMRPKGIRQLLEKKEGMFRMHMMGKRVNYAARSVISPDPFIHPNQIGVPPFVARTLTYPELVTPQNVEHLRKLVINGDEVYPGAHAVEDQRGNVINLKVLDKQKRKAMAKTLLAMENDRLPQTRAVYRHLQDGDMLLVNRQPTLHKPGVMAHSARVIKGQRTIRMHYANCSTYNADFDGDEMNLHLPQDEHGRAEAHAIVSASHQFTVPTDGKPLRGLIQDHVAAGTLLTKKDTFFERAEFEQLLYRATLGVRLLEQQQQLKRHEATYGASGEERPKLRISTGSPGAKLKVPPPAIMKPKPLWTGKQLVSSFLEYVTQGQPPLSMRLAGKVPSSYWGANSGEEFFEVFRGQVVTGVLDKNQFGKFGLVHAVHELFGSSSAADLLAGFSRLLTSYLQLHGMTCSYSDCLLTTNAEVDRKGKIDEADPAALGAAAAFGTLSEEDLSSATGDDETGERRAAKVREAVAAKLAERASAEAKLDMKSTGALNQISSKIIKACIPVGQKVAFPKNCLSLMTITGAKGSLVNFSQIAALLGQQELEGRRVPRMPSGKTLPCFRPFELCARAGGYVTDRFLTGLRPQEYYFHCMAGREGLVDTAVKTSRSGYLQRCLMKNLEALRVHYDRTVRDCDGSIVQFTYGDDGLEVVQNAYLNRFDFYAQNAQQMDAQLGSAVRALARTGYRAKPSQNFDGAISEFLAQQEVLGGLLAEPAAAALQKEGGGDDEDDEQQRRKKKKMKKKMRKAEELKRAALSGVPRATGEEFRNLMQARRVRAEAAPGEAVGVLAAQSVGEPSTQMTLNTFHFAGRGEANVTLGIPRLREILMAASKKISTPLMVLPLKPGLAMESARTVQSRLRKVEMAELLAHVQVVECPCKLPTPEEAQRERSESARRTYQLKLQFRAEASSEEELALSSEELKATASEREGPVKFHELVDAVRRSGGFVANLFKELKQELKRLEQAGIKRGARAGSADGAGDGAGANADDGDAAGAGGGDDDEDENEDDVEEGAKGESRRAEARDLHDVPDEDDFHVAREAMADATMATPADAATATKGDVRDENMSSGGESSSGESSDEFSSSEDEDDDDDGDVGRPSVLPAAKMMATKTKKKKKEKSQASKATAVAAPSPGAARVTRGTIMGILSSLASTQDGIIVDADAFTCDVNISLGLGAPKVLMLEIAERAARKTVVRMTPGINGCFVAEEGVGGHKGPCVQVEGINFAAAWGYDDLIDPSSITSNHIHAVWETYGVEAARATIVREVGSVFGVYGIAVDPRHLSLIADFMTHAGDYRPCSRLGIAACPSALLKMSFETATKFLMDATIKGSGDPLRSPSARIVLGRVVELGTGTCEVMYDFDADKRFRAEQQAA